MDEMEDYFTQCRADLDACEKRVSAILRFYGESTMLLAMVTKSELEAHKVWPQIVGLHEIAVAVLGVEPVDDWSTLQMVECDVHLEHVRHLLGIGAP